MDNLDRIRAMAQLSIGRACLFGLLAIATMMFGLAAVPDLAMRSGAILFLMTAAILALKALQAPRRSYKATELWILLEKRHDLPEPRAQSLIGSVLSETYWKFARIAGGVGIALWIADVLLRLSGLVRP
jgi:hypothetical protein